MWLFTAGPLTGTQLTFWGWDSWGTETQKKDQCCQTCGLGFLPKNLSPTHKTESTTHCGGETVDTTKKSLNTQCQTNPPLKRLGCMSSRSFTFIFYDFRRRRRGSISTQWHLTSAGTSVTGKLSKKKTNQAKLSSLFPHAQKESQETNLPTVAITPSKRGTHPLLNLLSYPQKTREQTRKEGTPSFQRHTMFKLNQNFEGNRPANSTLKDMSFTFFPFCNTRRAQNPNQPRLLSTSCISWHNMSRAMWQLKATFAT